MGPRCHKGLLPFSFVGVFLCLLIPADVDAKGEISAVRLRLGSAAAPFAWSTVVADFDLDHEPDVAMADRLGWQTFSIEITLSQGRRQSLVFTSSASALTITAQDVDKDEYLDLVVSYLFSDEVAGLWINDGQGRFTEDNPRDYDLSEPSSQSRITSPAQKSPDVIGNRRANDDSRAETRVSSPLASSDTAAAPLNTAVKRPDLLLHGAPRGPPVTIPSIPTIN